MVQCVYLVLVIKELGELWDGACGQLRIILVVDEVDHCVLEHLRGLGQPLHVSGVGVVKLSGGDLHALVQRLGEHGRPHPLRPRQGVLPIHVWRNGQEVSALLNIADVEGQ